MCVGRHVEVRKMGISGVLWKSSAQETPAGVGLVVDHSNNRRL